LLYKSIINKMSDFNKNLKGALNPRPSKEELRDRLKKKLEAKKALRGGKKTMVAQTKKTEESFRVNNSNDIRAVSMALMLDVERIYKSGVTSMPAIDKCLKGRYDFFKKKYFGIYRAVLARELPLNVLDMMIAHKQQIEDNKMTEEQASYAVGDIIAKKLNVDVEALKKSSEEKKQ